MRPIAILSFLLLLASTALAEKSIWKKLTSEPPLPAELTTDVDVFPMANTITPRRPLSFAPFAVTKLRTGWRRDDADAGRFPISRSASIEVGTKETRQKYMFTLNESDKPSWEALCAWSGLRGSTTYRGKTSALDSTLASEVTLQCDFAKPGGKREWSLDFGALGRARGLGAEYHIEGLIAGPSGEFHVDPLFVVEGSRIVGDVALGYVFRSRGSGVAAVQKSPRGMKFTVHRSIEPDERSMFAAATAALLIHERLAEPDPFD
jgi:hypothetical protein